MSLVEDFLRHLRGARNLSKHTLRAYAGDLRQFTLFLGGKETVAEGREGVATLRRLIWRNHASHEQMFVRMPRFIRSHSRALLRAGVCGKPALPSLLGRGIQACWIQWLWVGHSGECFTVGLSRTGSRAFVLGSRVNSQA